MSYSEVTEEFRDNGIALRETTVDLLDGKADLVVDFDESDAETDVLVIVQGLTGNFEFTHDSPLNEVAGNGRTHVVLSGEVRQAFQLRLAFFSKAFARVRVIVAKIRKGLTRAARSFPCKFCKLALKTIVSTILVHLGVPASPAGQFDLTNVAQQIATAAADIANGTYGAVVQSLHALLPSNYWNVILSVLQGLNWLLDATDKLYETICRGIGMCPPKAAVTP